MFKVCMSVFNHDSRIILFPYVMVSHLECLSGSNENHNIYLYVEFSEIVSVIID